MQEKMESKKPEGTWQLLESQEVARGRWFRLRKDKVKKADGEVVEDFFVLEKTDFAEVVGLTDDNRLVMVRQYRHSVGETTLELPAGYIEKGENAEQCAKREFEEETGYRLKRIEKLFQLMQDPATSTSIGNYFLGFGAEKTGQGFDEKEIQSVKLVPVGEAVDLALKGNIKDAGQAAAVLAAAERIGVLKKT